MNLIKCLCLITVVWLACSSTANGAGELVYQLDIQGPGNGLLNLDGTATFTVRAKVHPYAAASRQSTSEPGKLCLNRAAEWSWVGNAPTIRALTSRSDATSPQSFTIRASSSFTGEKEVRFSAVLGSGQCVDDARTAPEYNSILVANNSSESRIRLSSQAGSDKVMVTSFTISPEEPFEGQKVTVTMKLKALAKLSDVKWRLSVDQDTKEGNQATVNEGDPWNASITWVAKPGEHRFSGLADPNDQLQESTAANLSNNIGGPIIANVASLKTQVLSYKRAKDAGAGFVHNRNSGLAALPICLNCMGVQGGDNSCIPSDAPKSFTVLFIAECGPVPPIPPRGSVVVTPEAFTNFTLKNGWRLKSVETVNESLTGEAQWSWMTQPQPGGNSANMRMRIAVGAPGGTAYVFVRVLIEGPSNKSPYIEGAPN